MLRSDFAYQLPTELIAQQPLPRRSAAKMLVVQQIGGLVDSVVMNLPSLLEAGDLLVLNDTKVVHARLHLQRNTGGRVELLLERELAEQQFSAQTRSSKRLRIGERFTVNPQLYLELVAVNAPFYQFRILGDLSVAQLFDRYGEVPLPPYITRLPDSRDRERYQTVFAAAAGSVAAPTAGLHLDAEMLQRFRDRGICLAYLTLHVGAGTFLPIRNARIDTHRMHPEMVEVSPQVCEAIQRCRARGGRVIAVGTTVVRALETAAATGELKPFAGATDLYLRPGSRFRVVDRLFTNFHWPESSLLVLVAAFAGKDLIMRAYQHAIEQRYRFFSYGDAMLVSRAQQ